MYQNLTLKISALYMDAFNPRLEERERSQDEAILEMAVLQKHKLVNLAGDIAKNGLNPSEAFIVIEDSERNGYIVLEGNRRLAAIRILEDPYLVKSIFTQPTWHSLEKYHHQYLKKPITTVSCVLFSERNEAMPWIEQRHIGEKGGVGIVPWGGTETARFRQRNGGEPEVALQIIEFLEEQGSISAAEREGLPVTSLKRVVEDRSAQDLIGYKIVNGKLVVGENKETVAKLLKRVVMDFSTGQKKVKDIYHKQDRIRYLENIIAEESDGQPRSSHGIEQQPAGGTMQTANIPIPAAEDKKEEPSVPPMKKASRPVKNVRTHLIPEDCELNIDDDRIREIFDEIVRLPLIGQISYPNAVGVLLRVFLELSLDNFIYKHKDRLKKDPGDSNYRLSAKMVDVVDYLEKAGKINIQQGKAYRHTAQSDDKDLSMTGMLDQLVHNKYIRPLPADLISRWDNLEDFFKIIWL